MTDKPILNIKELAARLQLSRATIHNMLKAKRCPIQPIDGMKPPKWRTSDVDAFLTARNGDSEK